MRTEQNRTTFPSLVRGDVSGSELPSSGELGGSPKAAGGLLSPLNQQTGFPCPVTLARPSVTPPAVAVRNAGKRGLRLTSNIIISRKVLHEWSI